MAAAGKHRDKLVASAISLFRTQGYAATGLAEILTHSGAPRGSLYHYFPAGKEEIGTVALAAAGKWIGARMQELVDSSPTPGDMVRGYGRRMAKALEESGFTYGCPVATVVLEAETASSKLAAAGRDAFEAWCSVVARMLEAAGVAPERAAELGDFVVGTFEGALILARTRRTTKPLLQAAEELARVFDNEFLRMKER